MTAQYKTPFYEISEHIWTDEIEPNYPIVHLSNEHGTASLALHGAHVTSYTPNKQKPVIFTSKDAVYREGKAIRGGIPICWPWFNAHPSDSSEPSHGYGRNQFWKVKDSHHSSEITSITLELVQNNLKAVVIISLGKNLEISLTTTNLAGDKQNLPFIEPTVIGGALHSYFNVSDISNVSLSGLENIHFIDTLTETEEIQTGDIIINEEIDRIYINTNHAVSIYDAVWNRTIFVDKIGSQSTVIWNPWIDKTQSLGDLRNDEYKNFVCVETANARTDVYELAPGETHILGTQITVV